MDECLTSSPTNNDNNHNNNNNNKNNNKNKLFMVLMQGASVVLHLDYYTDFDSLVSATGVSVILRWLGV